MPNAEEVWVTIEFVDGQIMGVHRSQSEKEAVKIGLDIMRETWPSYRNNHRKEYIEELQEYGSVHSEISDYHIFITKLE